MVYVFILITSLNLPQALTLWQPLTNYHIIKLVLCSTALIQATCPPRVSARRSAVRALSANVDHKSSSPHSDWCCQGRSDSPLLCFPTLRKGHCSSHQFLLVPTWKWIQISGWVVESHRELSIEVLKLRKKLRGQILYLQKRFRHGVEQSQSHLPFATSTYLHCQSAHQEIAIKIPHGNSANVGWAPCQYRAMIKLHIGYLMSPWYQILEYIIYTYIVYMEFIKASWLIKFHHGLITLHHVSSSHVAFFAGADGCIEGNEARRNSLDISLWGNGRSGRLVLVGLDFVTI